MNEKKNDVWYKLRFTIGGLYLVLVFWWIAWSSLIAWSFMENTNSAAFEILEALVYLGFFIWILSFYKREYQSIFLKHSCSKCKNSFSIGRELFHQFCIFRWLRQLFSSVTSGQLYSCCRKGFVLYNFLWK